ncbi:MAG: hypothetical protein ACRCX4_14025 [Bacteroidales bacterium]
MKKNRYILLTALALLSSGIASAQSEKKEKQEETIERELLIEKEFTPIVRDASKITQLPAVEAPKGDIKKSTDYSFWSITGTPLYEVNPLAPAAIGTNMDFSGQKGYATLGMGNLWNIDAGLGYSFLRNANTDLSATYDFYNTSGKREGYFLPKATYKMFQNKLNVHLNQRISKVRLNANLTYNQAQFNQPVFTFAPDLPVTSVNGKNRQNNQVKLNLAIPQIRLAENYDMKLWANYSFYQKNNFMTAGEGKHSLTENYINAGTDLYGNVLGNLKAGASVNVTSWGTDNLMTAVNVTPKVGVTLDNFDFLVGVGLQFNPEAEALDFMSWPETAGLSSLYRGGKRFNIYPEIHMNWSFVPSASLFATVTGRSELSTFQNSDDVCYYAAPVAAQFAPVLNNIRFDGKIGVRALIANSLSLELFGGAVRYENAVYAKTMFNEGSPLLVNIMAPDFWSVRYGLKAELAMGSRLNIGAGIQGSTNMDHIQQPDFTADFNVGYRPVKPLLIDLSYQLLGERKAETATLSLLDYNNGLVVTSNPEQVKMKAANLLKLKATYDINKYLAAYVSANNLLNQKYDLWYGLPAQGINFMVGATLKF